MGEKGDIERQIERMRKREKERERERERDGDKERGEKMTDLWGEKEETKTNMNYSLGYLNMNFVKHPTVHVPTSKTSEHPQPWMVQVTWPRKGVSHQESVCLSNDTTIVTTDIEDDHGDRRDRRRTTRLDIYDIPSEHPGTKVILEIPGIHMVAKTGLLPSTTGRRVTTSSIIHLLLLHL